MFVDHSGYRRLLEFVEKCLPASDCEAAAAQTADSTWSIAQSAALPALLPELKFHELVFGQVLGEGSFSTVKYARHITQVSRTTAPHKTALTQTLTLTHRAAVRAHGRSTQ